jgi:hypothetical protein
MTRPAPSRTRPNKKINYSLTLTFEINSKNDAWIALFAMGFNNIEVY